MASGIPQSVMDSLPGKPIEDIETLPLPLQSLADPSMPIVIREDAKKYYVSIGPTKEEKELLQSIHDDYANLEARYLASMRALLAKLEAEDAQAKNGEEKLDIAPSIDVICATPSKVKEQKRTVPMSSSTHKVIIHPAKGLSSSSAAKSSKSNSTITVQKNDDDDDVRIVRCPELMTEMSIDSQSTIRSVDETAKNKANSKRAANVAPQSMNDSAPKSKLLADCSTITNSTSTLNYNTRARTRLMMTSSHNLLSSSKASTSTSSAAKRARKGAEAKNLTQTGGGATPAKPQTVRLQNENLSASTAPSSQSAASSAPGNENGKKGKIATLSEMRNAIGVGKMQKTSVC